MRFMIMHKTNGHWESGAIPGRDLIARVGAMLGEFQKAGVLLAGEGLRPSSEGARLTCSEGTRTIIHGPFTGDNELPAAFSIVRLPSLDDAIEWASRLAAGVGDCEVDIRPVTEPWDIGMGPRPAGVTTRRYMVLRKATAESEAGHARPSEPQPKLSRQIDETAAADVRLVTETMRPSARGRRYKSSRDGVRFIDGPFVESKEMIGGYVVVSGASIEDVHRWALQYIAAVGAEEVDVRALE